MVQTREERLKKKKEYYQNNKEHVADKGREYRQNNKEKIAEYKREWNEKNKEHLAEYKREWNEKNKEHLAEYHKIYSQTPAGKKIHMMAKWRHAGVINVNEKMYNDYIATTHCECCSKEFSSSKDRHLDHDHETGEFRWVICRNCNSHDNWKKIIHSVSQY